MNQIIQFFISAVTITYALVFIGKKIIEKFADSRIEKYKNTLQKDVENFKHQLSFETEEFKNKLSLSTIEHQVKYSKLYEERGDVIKQTYKLLLKTEDALQRLTTYAQGPDWGDQEKLNKTYSELDILKDHMRECRIFFNTNTCNKINDLLDDSYTILEGMLNAKLQEQVNNDAVNSGKEISTETLLLPRQEWKNLGKKVAKDINAAILEIAQEFRILIGATDDTGNRKYL